MKLIIFTDGASRGNPGNSSYGFAVYNEEKKILYEEGKYLGIQTNNFAEYSAVLGSLLYIQKNHSDVEELNFFLDSLLVVRQLSGKYKIKSENLKLLIEKIKLLEAKFPKTTYQHIPRSQNSKADSLANQALDKRIDRRS